MHIKENANLYMRTVTLLLVIIEFIRKVIPLNFKVTAIAIIVVSIIVDFSSYYYWRKFHQDKIVEYATYLLFVLLGIFNLFNPKTVVTLYLYFLVVAMAELMVKHTPTPKHIIIIDFIIYFFFFTVPTVIDLDFSKGISYFEVILNPFTIQFWSSYFITYLYVNLAEKNRAIDALNKELMNKVDQLQDYSSKIKELTLIEERQRISQNLHDMLGHSLIGLRLHLDALNQFIDNDPQKSHQILDKSKGIIDHSLVELRETVDELNETKELADLKSALEELRDSISVTGQVKVDLQTYFDVNKLDISIKDLIYKTCQEFITNSIKHGHSSLVTIKLRMNNDQMNLKLTNNGQNVDEIKASNGINGIKERVRKLNGQVDFSNNQPNGFKTEINLPIGANIND